MCAFGTKLKIQTFSQQRMESGGDSEIRFTCLHIHCSDGLLRPLKVSCLSGFGNSFACDLAIL